MRRSSEPDSPKCDGVAIPPLVVLESLNAARQRRKLVIVKSQILSKFGTSRCQRTKQPLLLTQ